jgi:hypothetical protein
VIDALKRGWDVFRDNLGEMVLMGLVLVLGGMIVSFVVAMPMILTIIPLMMGIIAAIAGDSGALVAGGVVVSGLCCVAYLPVLIIVSGIVRAYIGTAWTLTYLRLTKGPADEVSPEMLPDGPNAPQSLPEIKEATDTDLTDETDDTSVSEAEKTPEETKDTLPEDF